MSRLATVFLAASLVALPAASYGAAPAAAPAPAAEKSEPAAAHSDHRLLAVGAGAIVGVVLFNMLTYPLGSVPFVAGPLASTPVDIALGSRVLASITGGTGALVAHYLYGSSEAKAEK